MNPFSPAFHLPCFSHIHETDWAHRFSCSCASCYTHAPGGDEECASTSLHLGHISHVSMETCVC